MKAEEFGKKGWTPERLESLNGKTYAITGANAGAGFEATQILLNKGAEVVMLNRNEKKSHKAIDELKGQFGADAKVSFIKMGLKTIQFDDMNFDKNYHPNNTYCHSKLAQMMFAFELQHRIDDANKEVKVYVCHPGASKTSLINKDTPLATRMVWAILSASPLVQSAEKGAYPEVMCATEDKLKQQAYYGPTGMMNWGGPVGECEMESFVWDRAIAGRLWEVSEKETDCKWNF